MKKVIITMDEKGQFSVNGQGINSIEILGILEFAKLTVQRDIMLPGKKHETKTGLEGSKPPLTEDQIKQSQTTADEPK